MNKKTDESHTEKLLDQVYDKLWGLYLEMNALTQLIFNSRQDDTYTMENIEISGLDHLMGRLTDDIHGLHGQVGDREIT